MNRKNTSTLLLGALVLMSLIVLPAIASAFVDVPNCSIVRIGADNRLMKLFRCSLTTCPILFFQGSDSFL
jgi:hypothetical protein